MTVTKIFRLTGLLFSKTLDLGIFIEIFGKKSCLILFQDTFFLTLVFYSLTVIINKKE